MSRLLALGVLAMLTGCASGGAVSTGQDFGMASGQRVSLPDASTLRYAGIANDSRCPPDVQCIRAGDADVLFDYAAVGHTPGRVTLNTERTRSAVIGNWQLQLVDLASDEAPRATVRIETTHGGTAP
jgi:hypothetical protein